MDFTISPTPPEHFGKLRAIELAAFETLHNADGLHSGATCSNVGTF